MWLAGSGTVWLAGNCNMRSLFCNFIAIQTLVVCFCTNGERASLTALGIITYIVVEIEIPNKNVVCMLHTFVLPYCTHHVHMQHMWCRRNAAIKHVCCIQKN